jgi:hypothetical protein
MSEHRPSGGRSARCRCARLRNLLPLWWRSCRPSSRDAGPLQRAAAPWRETSPRQISHASVKVMLDESDFCTKRLLLNSNRQSEGSQRRASTCQG